MVRFILAKYDLAYLFLILSQARGERLDMELGMILYKAALSKPYNRKTWIRKLFLLEMRTSRIKTVVKICRYFDRIYSLRRGSQMQDGAAARGCTLNRFEITSRILVENPPNNR